MSDLTQAAPVAEAQNTATELTNEPSEVVTEQATAEPEQESPEDAQAKAIKRMERRINRKHAEAAEARAEVAFLKKQLEARAPKEEAEPEDVERAVETRAEQRARELVRQGEFKRSVDSVMKAGASLTGFDAACNAVFEELPMTNRDGTPTAFLSAVLESDAPAKLFHHLGNNPDLLEELAGLSETKRIRRLERIEQDMATPKTSAAPKPLTPVKAVVSDNSLSSAKSDQEWAERREAELREKRKRI